MANNRLPSTNKKSLVYAILRFILLYCVVYTATRLSSPDNQIQYNAMLDVYIHCT